MPKDSEMLTEAVLLHSPIGGLSDPLFQAFMSGSELGDGVDAAIWAKSPVGGLSLPEFLRIAGVTE
ncbi:MAG: hypothetical protein F8N37_03730 [Telmatospirillum sp.]|nr:hypothetical protein [Telmatospirillum sp.]